MDRSHHLIAGNPGLLGACGIWIKITLGKRHQKVFRAERVVRQVKRIILNLVRNYLFEDIFDFVHKISLVKLLINKSIIFLPIQGYIA